jgi:hypothetical protein
MVTDGYRYRNDFLNETRRYWNFFDLLVITGGFIEEIIQRVPRLKACSLIDDD